MTKQYKVGYGKPPRRTRFTKGQSGNPNGRPKGGRNLKTDLEEELAERILVREGQSERRISKQRAVLKSLFARALRGDPRAMRLVVDLTCRLMGIDEVADVDLPLPEEDNAILENHRQSILREAAVKRTSSRRRRERRSKSVAPLEQG